MDQHAQWVLLPELREWCFEFFDSEMGNTFSIICLTNFQKLSLGESKKERERERVKTAQWIKSSKQTPHGSVAGLVFFQKIWES